MNENRRQFPRFAFDKGVSFRQKNPQVFQGGLAKDISLGGLKITVNDFIPVGSVLEMAVDFPPYIYGVITKGKVVWIRENTLSERFDVGVEFMADQALKDQLEKFLANRQPE